MAGRQQRLLVRHECTADSERKMTPVGVTLVSFVRGQRLNVSTWPQRVRPH